MSGWGRDIARLGLNEVREAEKSGRCPQEAADGMEREAKRVTQCAQSSFMTIMAQLGGPLSVPLPGAPHIPAVGALEPFNRCQLMV